MSSERNVEAVGCDASIMRNVWEIREREFDQKMQNEQQRMEKSALQSINEDWANRLAVRQGTYKRVERKAKRAEAPADDASVWKSKPQARPAPAPAPRGLGPAPTKRATPQRGLASQAKDKKGQEKGSNKMHLIMYLTNMQPSAMVWGKSWKFKKDLPQPEEGATLPSDWGQGWMFMTQQPFTEPGKPWPNGPCQINPAMLHLCDKPVFRVANSENLDWDFCSDEWNMSWKNANKENKESASSEGHGFFASLVESHHNNINMYSSEWSDGWKSTKPSDKESPADVSNVESTKQASGEQVTSEWSECWKLGNHHGLCKTAEVRQSHSPEWLNSWRAAMMVQNNNESSVKEGHAKDHHKAKEFVFVSNRNKHRSLFSDLDKEFKAFSEWDKSWQVSKNDSKPSAEIEKTLKTEPPKMETSLKVQEKPKMDSSSTSEQASKFAQLKNMVLFRPKREVTHSVLSHLKHLEKTSTGSEWKDAWKMLKHQLRMERQRMRPDPLKPFEEKGEKMKPSSSEWNDSWKITNPTLGQNPEMWQQRWTTTPQIRVDRAREYNHFAPVVLPKNGPKGERSWNESWRWSRHQIEPSQRGSAAASNNPTTSQHPQRPHMRSAGDWQEAWMFSESQHRRDKPSYSQWMEAWKSSAFQTGIHPCNELITGERWLAESLEIKMQKEMYSVQKANTKMSRSFEMSMFKQRYPEKQWIDSWKVGSVLKECGFEGNATVQPKMGVSNEYGSKWGMSFRLANPMPKMDQPWVKSSANPCYYAVKWPRRKISHTSINADFTNNPRIPKLWANSQQFLQSFSAKIVSKNKPSKPVDPRVIYAKKINLKKHLYLNLEKKEKQMEKKWAGSQLLGKTQPKPKKGEKRVKLEEGESGDKFVEEWAESWRFLVRANGLKTKAVKSLRGWEEAWKFLLPLYQLPKPPRGK